jgi:hypothetical protein
MTDRFIKGKLVAFRGFTTKKKFLGKLSETFSKEALAALSLQTTTMAYAFGEIVKGFYFSLNVDAVPPTEQQSLYATLVRSELGHAIRWTLPLEPQLTPESLKVQDVVKVYEGQAGQCRCGCSGEYYYNPAFDSEINRRNADPDQFLRWPEPRKNSLTDVTRVVELVNSHLTDEYDTVSRMGEMVELEIGEHVWTAYTKEVFEIDDRVTKNLREERAPEAGSTQLA